MRINYFENEKGDYTITLDGEPVANCKDKDSAIKLISVGCPYSIIQAEELVKVELPYLYGEKVVQLLLK